MPRLADLAAALVAPDRCLHCRSPARPGALLCDACRRALPWIGPAGCPRCGLPRPCRPRRCPARRSAFAAAWAPLAYEGPARTLALAAKERAAERAGRWLGAAVGAGLPDRLRVGIDVVVPVPPDPRRRRRRGTDHAALLAAAAAAVLGVPAERRLRRDPAPEQHRSDRATRLRLAAPAATGTVRGGVLLVDDVHTTGATLDGAARALRAAGASRVVAATALRALR